MEGVIDNIINKHTENVSAIGSHSLKKIGSEMVLTYSETIVKNIYNVKATIKSVRTVIEGYKKTLDNHQRVYLSEHLPKEYRGEFIVSTEVNNKIDVKFAVIGFLFGVAATFAVYVCRMIFSSKLQNEEDIEILFGTKTLSKITTSKNSKKSYASRIAYKGMEFWTSEEQIDYLVCVLANICKSKNIESFSFVMNINNDTNNKLFKEISDKLTALGIKTYVSYNIMQNKEELEKVLEINNNIIVGNIEKSYYKILDKQIKMLGIYDSNILGCVIVE